MSDELSRAKDIGRYSFLRVFANDDTIDQAELDFMKRLTLQDEDVDDAERETLSTIFGRVSPESVDPDVWADIVRFKERYDIP